MQTLPPTFPVPIPDRIRGGSDERRIAPLRAPPRGDIPIRCTAGGAGGKIGATIAVSERATHLAGDLPGKSGVVTDENGGGGNGGGRIGSTIAVKESATPRAGALPGKSGVVTSVISGAGGGRIGATIAVSERATHLSEARPGKSGVVTDGIGVGGGIGRIGATIAVSIKATHLAASIPGKSGVVTDGIGGNELSSPSGELPSSKRVVLPSSSRTLDSDTEIYRRTMMTMPPPPSSSSPPVVPRVIGRAPAKYRLGYARTCSVPARFHFQR